MTAPDAPTAPAPAKPAKPTSADYRRMRGPNLVMPALDDLLKTGEWVPEYLLAQVAGHKVHWLRAAESYKSLRKGEHKPKLRARHPDWAPERVDEEAAALAAADYNADHVRADWIGRKRVVVHSTLRQSPRYESRGRAKEREWRLRPDLVLKARLQARKQSKRQIKPGQEQPGADPRSQITVLTGQVATPGRGLAVLAVLPAPAPDCCPLCDALLALPAPAPQNGLSSSHEPGAAEAPKAPDSGS